MIKFIKKYWKQYLENVWYFNLFYWFSVFMHWKFDNTLDLFRPFSIIYLLFVSGFLIWLSKKLKLDSN